MDKEEVLDRLREDLEIPFFQGKLSGYRPLRASTADPPKKIFNSSIFSS